MAKGNIIETVKLRMLFANLSSYNFVRFEVMVWMSTEITVLQPGNTEMLSNFYHSTRRHIPEYCSLFL